MVIEYISKEVGASPLRRTYHSRGWRTTAVEYMRKRTKGSPLRAALRHLFVSVDHGDSISHIHGSRRATEETVVRKSATSYFTD